MALQVSWHGGGLLCLHCHVKRVQVEASKGATATKIVISQHCQTSKGDKQSDPESKWQNQTWINKWEKIV